MKCIETENLEINFVSYQKRALTLPHFFRSHLLTRNLQGKFATGAQCGAWSEKKKKRKDEVTPAEGGKQAQNEAKGREKEVYPLYWTASSFFEAVKHCGFKITVAAVLGHW